MLQKALSKSLIHNHLHGLGQFLQIAKKINRGKLQQRHYVETATETVP